MNWHTEEEAKSTWCPFAQANDSTGVVTNRTMSHGSWVGGLADPDCKCLASECGMWVWSEAVRATPTEDTPCGGCGLRRLP